MKKISLLITLVFASFLSYAQVDAGMVSTSSGDEEVNACAGDSELLFTVQNSSSSPEKYAYIITSDQGDILGFPPSNTIDITGAPLGTCYVYGFSYTGTLDSTAATINTLTSDGTFDLSTNWITVTRGEAAGGMVSTNWETEVTAVVGDPSLNFMMAKVGASSSAKYAYIITSDQGDILGFPPSNRVNITGAPAGTCYVYGFSYTGTLDSTATTIGSLTSDGCYELSTNWVTVTRTAPTVEAGFVYADGMVTEVSACQGDAELAFAVNNDSKVSAKYAYVITSDQGDILGFPPSNNIDITGAPVGTCYVYGFSYTGTLDSTAATIGSLTSDADYELSANWVTVTRGEAAAGMVSTNGQTTVTAEVGDPALDFMISNDAPAIANNNYAYVITNDQGDILGFPPSNSISISGAPIGTCYVYGFSYSGTLDSTATTIGSLTSDGCYELSTNWVTVTRTAPTVEAGFVYADGMVTEVSACQGDAELAFAVNNDSQSNSKYAYIITSDQGDILGFPPSNNIDITGAPVGTCYVYGFSYTGTLDSTAATIGSLTSDADYELSANWVTVTRGEAAAGMVSTNGQTTVTAEVGDPALDFMISNDAPAIANNNYAYVITNDQGDILGFPPSNNISISGAPIGTCYVYGFSYSGTLDSTATTIGSLTSDGCYELSTNWVTVTRTAPTVEAGFVYADGMVTEVSACQGDAELAFAVNNDSRANANYAYVITNDQGDILGFPPSNNIDITGAPVGTCYVYGFSYTGTLDSTAATIGSLTSDADYELSANWVTVTRGEAAAGMVSTNGQTTITAEVGDPALDFMISNDAPAIANNNYAYVITNDQGDILGFPPSNNISISGAPIGTCYVYGFSYSGTLDSTATTIGSLTSDGCYELSTNWVTVTRTAPTVEAGFVYADGMVTEVSACQGDAELAFAVNNDSRANANYAYVITNDQGDILGFPPSNNIDITGAPVGTCYVYGFSYTGTLDSTAATIGSLTSDADYELSANWVTVTRGEAAAGMVSTNGQTAITAEAGDPALNFTISNDAPAIPNTNYAYVITTDQGDILGFPPSNNIDISGAPVGTCYVYGFSYTGTLDSTAATIWDLSSDGCYELSTNWVTVTRTTVTGTRDLIDNASIGIFPSIASETITIDGLEEVSSISILTSTGQEVLSSTDQVIDIQELTSGAYIVRVISAENIAIGRFIKK